MFDRKNFQEPNLECRYTIEKSDGQHPVLLAQFW
jgi:hypothetical protein